MKKSLIISIGVVAALIVGAVFYSMGVPGKINAALTPGTGLDSPTGVKSCLVNGVVYPCNQPGVLCQGDSTSENTALGTHQCGLEGGAYGTISDQTYFSEASASAFVQGGGTTEQVNAIDGIYAACKNLIASKPTDGGMDPRSQSCGDFKYTCHNNELRCLNWSDSQQQWNLIGSNAKCDAPNGFGGHCGGDPAVEAPGCGSLTGGSGGVTVGQATGGIAEFNPSNPGFGTTTLKLGSSGTEVIALQSYLIAGGFLSAGSATGSFNAATETALKAWQTSTGLKVDGVWGAQGRAAARLLIDANPDPRAHSYVKWGNCSNGVRQCNLYYQNGTIAETGINADLCQPHPAPSCGDTIQR